jgi:HlyD family secretion protein
MKGLLTPRLSCAAALVAALAGCSSSADSERLVGTLERDRIEIVAEASEPIVSIEVREGQHVALGDVLMRQETDVANARGAQAEAQVAQARQRLAELERGARTETIDEARARLAAAKAAAERDEKDLKRVKELIERRLVAQSQLDQATAARNASEASVREAQAGLTALLRGNRVEDVEEGRAALAAAESARRGIEITDSRLVVRATRAGVVDALPYEVGERPPTGRPVVVMLADTPAFARVYVPEPRRARIRPGMKAEISVDGVEKPLQGVVRWVAHDAAFTPYYALTQRDRSRLSFLAEIEIQDERVRDLPAGVPVEVTILGEDRG